MCKDPWARRYFVCQSKKCLTFAERCRLYEAALSGKGFNGQSDLAEALGVSRRQVSRFLSALKLPYEVVRLFYDQELASSGLLDELSLLLRLCGHDVLAKAGLAATAKGDNGGTVRERLELLRGAADVLREAIPLTSMLALGDRGCASDVPLLAPVSGTSIEEILFLSDVQENGEIESYGITLQSVKQVRRPRRYSDSYSALFLTVSQRPIRTLLRKSGSITPRVARAIAVLIDRFGEEAVVEASRQLNNAKPQPIMVVLNALSSQLAETCRRKDKNRDQF